MALPSGYTQVEYIKTSGTQFIDTGITISSANFANLRVVADMELIPTSGAWCVTGTGGSSNCFAYFGINGNSAIAYGSGSADVATTHTYTRGRYIWDYDVAGGAFKVGNSVSISMTKGTPNGSGNFLISGYLASNLHSEIIYAYKIYLNGALVRDFVPCKNSSGTIGLYDLVNSKFYTNAGSGSFLCGETVNSGGSGGGKTLINGTAYSISRGRTLIGGTAYGIAKGRTLVDGTGYDILLGVPYDPVFSNNDWATIIAVCQAGICPDEWAVGDQKAMAYNGTDYLVDIIGKNHDTYTDGSGTAPLTFQMHDCYGTSYVMNTGATNNGGWGNSAMRNTHLPAILALMPSEVQAAIKEVNKKTSAGSQSSSIKTTADKLFLLSATEVFGSVNFAMSGEGSRYAYYAAGNSAKKNRNGGASNWWNRSPYRYDSTGFTLVNSVAAETYTLADYSQGVAPAFCF